MSVLTAVAGILGVLCVWIGIRSDRRSVEIGGFIVALLAIVAFVNYDALLSANANDRPLTPFERTMLHLRSGDMLVLANGDLCEVTKVKRSGVTCRANGKPFGMPLRKTGQNVREIVRVPEQTARLGEVMAQAILNQRRANARR
jgi:hypothetical protein